MKLENRKDYRARRHMRLRQKVKGTAARPRLAVFISNSHMYVQFVDDDAGSTLASASTLGTGATVNLAAAKALGEKAAEAAKAKGISEVVFDRGGFAYGRRLKALADAAREAGLKF